MIDLRIPQHISDDHWMEAEAVDAAFERIAELIGTTNNGKLMVMRIPPELRSFVPDLLEDGRLQPAGFIRTSDSVRL